MQISLSVLDLIQFGLLFFIAFKCISISKDSNKIISLMNNILSTVKEIKMFSDETYGDIIKQMESDFSEEISNLQEAKSPASEQKKLDDLVYKYYENWRLDKVKSDIEIIQDKTRFTIEEDPGSFQVSTEDVENSTEEYESYMLDVSIYKPKGKMLDKYEFAFAKERGFLTVADATFMTQYALIDFDTARYKENMLSVLREEFETKFYGKVLDRN